MPFVLHSQPTAVYQEHSENLIEVAADTHQRYAEIMRDVENLINDHSITRLALLYLYSSASETHIV